VKRLVFAALTLGATLAAGQSSGFKSDWEREQEARDWRELEVTLPALPKGELIEFFVSAASSFRFFVDPQSLSVGNDGVVRYTLVARSPSGAENVSYEGMRCSTASYKIYALGHGSNWTRAQGDWKTIQPKSVQRWHEALSSEYLCPNRIPVSSVAQAVEHLRLGGHPDFRRKY
jgi:hypothetical protein